MKKLGKIILSVCMAFMISLSLVACDKNNNDDGGNGGTQTYTPPTGVDMTSMSEYTKWLLDNPELQTSYVGSVTETEGVNTKTSLIKYAYKNNIQCIATYNSSNTLESYVEIEGITSTSCVVRKYNPSTMTYTETITSNSDAQKQRANLYCADAIVMQPYQIELNQGLEIGTDLTTVPGYSGIVVTNTVTNPSTGKYVMTRNMSMTVESVNVATTYVITMLNNKALSCNLTSNANKSLVISYEYKDVTIDFSKTGYTKAS